MEALEVLARRGHVPMPDKRAKVAGTDSASKVDIFKANLWASQFFGSVLWKTEAGQPAGNIWPDAD